MTEADLEALVTAAGWTLVKEQRKGKQGTRLRYQARQWDSTTKKTRTVHLCSAAKLPAASAEDLLGTMQQASQQGSSQEHPLDIRMLPGGSVLLRRGGNRVILTEHDLQMLVARLQPVVSRPE